MNKGSNGSLVIMTWNHNKEKLRFLETALASIGEGVIIVDISGRYLYINDAGKRLVQHSLSPDFPVEEQLTIFKFRYPDGNLISAEEMPLARALQGETVNDFLTKGMDSGGSEAFTNSSSYPVKDGDGRIIGAIVIFREVTGQLRDEKETLELHKMLRSANEHLTAFAIKAQEAAERAVNAQQELDRFFALSQDLMCIVDFNSYPKRINPAWERILGFRNEEISDNPLLNLIHPDDREKTAKEFENLSKGFETVSFENRYRCKDGSYRWILWSGTPSFRDELIYSTGHDITEWKEAQKELEESENRYRSLFENMPVGFAYHQIVLDEEGQPVDYIFLEVNESFQELTGLKREDLIGKKVTEVIPDIVNSRFEWIDTYGNVALTGEFVHFEQYSETFKRWYSITAYSPESGYFVTVFSDITERRKADEERSQLFSAIERERQRVQELADTISFEKDTLDTIMENTHTLIAYLDPHFRFVRVNQSYVVSSGHSRDELLGQAHFDLFPNPENQAIFQKVMNTGQPVEFHAKPFAYPDQPWRGTTYWDWSLVPVKDGEGRVQGLVFSLLDVTEETIAKQALEKTRQELEIRVTERTAELAKANNDLQAEIVQRREAEEQQKSLASYIRLLLESTDEGIYSIDSEGLCTIINRAAASMFGYQPEDLLGKNLHALTHHLRYDRSSFPSTECPIHRVMKTNKGCRIEDEVFWRKDGTFFSVEYSAFPFAEQDAETGVVVTFTDITSRKQTEEARMRLAAILEATSDLIGMTDIKGNIIYVNSAGRNMLGIGELGEISELKISDTHPAWATDIIFIQGIPTAIAEGIWQGETALLSTEKQEIPVSQVIISHKDMKGNVQYLSTIARDITEQKLAKESLNQSIENLQKAMQQTIHAMSLTVEMRDPYTSGHERRVSRIASSIAREMGLPEETVLAIEMAADVHDIGKIYVPAEILSKPGSLAQIEFKIIKTHSQVGYDVLKTVEFPWPIAQIVLQHHERMNGSGYPFSLKEEEILLEARVIAVADVVEAMESHRPYRPALGIDKALDEIIKNRGILYDASVVDACMNVFKSIGLWD